MLLRAPDTRHWTELDTPSRTTVIAVGAGGLVVVALLLLALLGSSNGPAVAESPTSVRLTLAALDRLPQDGIVLGDPAAPATLVVFSALDVPSRGIGSALRPLATGPVAEGRLKLELRTLSHDPERLAPDDGDAARVARVAQAAGLQDKQWQLLAVLADGSPGYVDEDLLDDAVARVPGLDRSRVRHDARSPRISAAVARADAMAEQAEVGPDAPLVLERDGQAPVALARQAPDRLLATVERALAAR